MDTIAIALGAAYWVGLHTVPAYYCFRKGKVGMGITGRNRGRTCALHVRGIFLPPEGIQCDRSLNAGGIEIAKHNLGGEHLPGT